MQFFWFTCTIESNLEIKGKSEYCNIIFRFLMFRNQEWEKRYEDSNSYRLFFCFKIPQRNIYQMPPLSARSLPDDACTKTAKSTTNRICINCDLTTNQAAKNFKERRIYFRIVTWLPIRLLKQKILIINIQLSVQYL